MCNRYLIKAKLEEVAQRYNARLIAELDGAGEFLPRAMAPGLFIDDEDERLLGPMQFSFCPPGCPSPSDPKRALNNARIESAGKWPWKDAFRTTRCVLPMTEFREPCYWGETAGSEVYFSRADADLLHAAGIYRVWSSPDGKTRVVTMSLLMRPASDYIMDRGHHRQPLFIDEHGVDQWIRPGRIETDAGVDLLRSIAAEPEFTHTHARDMAASWTKRRAAKLKERDQQLAALDSAPAVGF